MSTGSQAESVMIAGLFLYAARDLASSTTGWAGRRRGPHGAARADMLAVVEQQGWDGEWYLRAFDAEGRKVGSKECEEGQIFIESQGWCVLGGAGADNGRARQALESVHARLYTPDGIVLQQPPYSTYHLELGEVSSYPPGYKENAGIFSHNNTWIHLGWCLLGEGERALEYYHSICPSAKLDQIETYRCEPYVYAQMTAGRDAAPGRGEEFVAHRHRGLVHGHRHPGHPRHPAGLRRPAGGSLPAARLARGQGDTPLPRRGVCHHDPQPRACVPGREAADGGWPRAGARV
jgi:cellobiose phosphorylase